MKYICILLTAATSLYGGVYWTADEDGNVSRHIGDTPYPEGAAWVSEVPSDTPAEELRIVDGVVKRKPLPTAEEQAAQQAAQLQAIVDQAGTQISALYAALEDLSVPLPVTSATDVMHDLKTNLPATAENNKKIQELMFLFIGLSDAGLDLDTIRNVHTYMEATGQ